MPKVRSTSKPTLVYPKTHLSDDRAKPNIPRAKRNLTLMPGSKTYST